MPIDYSKYPPNWKTEIRPAVLKRADNKCENCGFKNYQLVYRGKKDNRINWYHSIEDAIKDCGKHLIFKKPVKVVLTVAHLDHDETNHDVKLERLAALCQLCHLRYDAKEKYRRAKLNH